jgi:hypothetical protein
LDDRPDLLRGWRRFDYGHRIPAGNTGSRMNIRGAFAGMLRNCFCPQGNQNTLDKARIMRNAKLLCNQVVLGGTTCPMSAGYRSK